MGTVETHPLDYIEDCKGMVVLPAPVEIHSHLDKALLNQTLGRNRNRTGDLDGAMAAMHDIELLPNDVFDRAQRAALELIGNGATTIRSHVDVRDPIATQSLKTLKELSGWLEDSQLGTLELSCLMGRQLSGREGLRNRSLLRESIELGADVLGGCPYLDDNPKAALRILLDAAEDAGLPVDLHTDETLSEKVFTLRDLIEEMERRGTGLRVTASHCVSLSAQTERTQSETAKRLAQCGITVVALPQTNLYLQARGITNRPPRAIIPAKLLIDAGVNVAAGADNVQDPFCPVGRLDPLETASLMIMAAHLSPEEAWEACSNSARKALGMEEISFAAGSPADFLVVGGNDLASAISLAPPNRIAVRRGKIVSRKAFTSTLSSTLP